MAATNRDDRQADPKKPDTNAIHKDGVHTDHGQGEERLEDEEKILAGRHDVNYPALLTKDVPGG